MQRLIGLPRQIAVDGDQIARPRRLARDDDLVLPQARLDGQLGRLQGREHHALVDDLFRGPAEVAVGVLLHLRQDELLVERAAVDADADGLAVVARDGADGRELLVTAPAGADVAGIDAVLVERPGAIGIAGEQQVPVVMEVADERRGHAGVEHALLDLGHGGRGFRQVDRDPHHLGPGLGELDALSCRALRIRRVGHGHRLHDDRRAAADLHGPDADPDCSMELEDCHVDNPLIIASSCGCGRAGPETAAGSGRTSGAHLAGFADVRDGVPKVTDRGTAGCRRRSIRLLKRPFVETR